MIIFPYLPIELYVFVYIYHRSIKKNQSHLKISKMGFTVPILVSTIFIKVFPAKNATFGVVCPIFNQQTT